MGTDNVPGGQRGSFRSFARARRFARALGLQTIEQWKAFCRGELPGRGVLPEDVPKAPQVVYRGRGWRGYPDWLGAGA